MPESLSMTLRLLFVISLVSLLAVYVALKFARALPRQKRLVWWGTAVAYAWALGWQFAYRARPDWIEAPGFHILAWTGGVAMALWATFLILSLPVDFALGLALLGRKLFKVPPMSPGRRATLRRGIPAGVLALSGTMTGIGLGQALSGAKVREIEVPIEGLPEALRGLRIAQISDLHVGPTIRKGYVEDVVARVMEAKPDLIALTGDVADGTPGLLRRHIAPLEGLRAPLGQFYVTGNHEYYWGGLEWIDAMRELGMTPLLNEHRIIEHRGTRLLVGGVTDPAGEKFFPTHKSDPRRAASDGGTAAFRLLLAHRPDSCDEAEPAGFDLQLSGHTHAGQFHPWAFFVARAYRYYKGLNRHGRMWVYVNGGTGYWGPPNRFGVPSEITLLRLV